MSTPRKIPATMATQHPDNACVPYFSDQPFIDTHTEVEECYRMFHDLKMGEYMWDWEGKFVDEAVIDRLFRNYHDFFKKHLLGKDFFLTFRIPNIWEEKGYRLARAFMNILTSEDFAKELKFLMPPIFEVILPMTSSASQLIDIQKTFQKVAKFKNEIFKTKNLEIINVIPLFEGVKDLVASKKVLEEYLKLFKNYFGEYPKYLRPFIARSDPALNSGLVPAVISAKVALSGFYEIEKKFGIKMFPIIGTGSLPFRGGVNPDNIKEVIKEYYGIRTLTIQPAFRYDYSISKVQRALRLIERVLPEMEPKFLSPSEIENIEKINNIFSGYYQKTVENLAVMINKIAEIVPSRRERMLHIGLFGYSRGMGKVRLPRAIKFTASLYSIGIPPEFIGTGRGLRDVEKMGLSEFLKNVYLNLEADLVHAGKYLNKENLTLLAENSSYFKDIWEDIRLVEFFLGKELGPRKPHHFIHRNLTSTIYLKMGLGEDCKEELEQAARIRKSLG